MRWLRGKEGGHRSACASCGRKPRATRRRKADGKILELRLCPLCLGDPGEGFEYVGRSS